MSKIDLEMLPKEDLIKMIKMFSRNSLVLDGCWFQAAEDKYGQEAAIDLDTKAWARYASIEARRILKTFNIVEKGTSALAKALNYQIWVHAQNIEWDIPEVTENRVVLNVTDCGIQRARIRSGRGEFPCKGVGIALFEGFVKAFDPEFSLNCLVCPPDEHPDDLWCSWEFRLEKPLKSPS